MNEKLRKRIVPVTNVEERNPSKKPTVDLINNAEIVIESESSENPIDNIVDGSSGRGSTKWIAGVSGTQSIIFNFDNPQNITEITYEIEETIDTRTQEILIEKRSSSEQNYMDVIRQEYNFSPNGSVFQREIITRDIPQTISIKMTIKPDKGNTSFTAKLNNIEFKL